MTMEWVSWKTFVYASTVALSLVTAAVFAYSFAIEHAMEISDDVRYYPDQQAQRELFEKAMIDYGDDEAYLDNTTML